MKKPCFAAAVAVAVIASFASMPARAADENTGGLGFHVGSSPFAGILISAGPTTTPTLGIRQWFSSVVGVDLGVGYNVFDAVQGTQKETWTGFALDAGLPFVAKQWQRVTFIARPGFQLGKLKDEDKTVAPTLTTKWTVVGVTGEFEVEWMVADKVSLSASQGLGWRSLKSEVTPSSPLQKFTSFGTTGSNFTELGFHVYLW